ncbi:MAG: hypothetical protein HXY48_09335 [Ignavibacteriaceae bacterium]|nr:hypothetical protein [Ignavibacteriaceae bacterium]
MKKLLLLAVFIVFTSTNIFSQAIPKQIDYQGVLKTSAGTIVPDGNYQLTFKIYNDPTGGTPLWSEAQTVAVANGIFSAHLGSITPITTVPFNRIHFLGITIGADPELSPRTLLTPSPYSFMAMNVMDNTVVKSLNSLKDDVNLVAGSNITITPSGNNLTISAAGGGGGTVTQVNTGAGLTGGPITTTGTISVANDGITTAMLQNNSVTSAKIVDGTVATADLGDNSITSAKILDGTIVSGDLANNSVTSAKIVDNTITSSDLSNNSVTSVKILDEPGIAEVRNETPFSIAGNTAMTTIATLSITIPAAGYIVLEGKSIAWFSGVTGQNELYMQIDETEGGTIVNPYWTKAGLQAYASTGQAFFPVSCQRTYTKSTGGTYTFYLEAMPVSSNVPGATTNLYITQFRAIYYPTAYGGVTSIKESSGGNDESISLIK